MAEYLLRLDDELLNYAREQAPIENRSVNSFIANLIQERMQKIEPSEIIKELERMGNNQLMKSFSDMIKHNENILIIGNVRSGKTLLIERLMQLSGSLPRVGNIDFLIKESKTITIQEFSTLLSSYKNKIENNMYEHITLYIDLYDHIFLKENSEYWTELHAFLKSFSTEENANGTLCQSKKISFIVTAPYTGLHKNQPETEYLMTDFFINKIYLQKAPYKFDHKEKGCITETTIKNILELPIA